MSVAEMKLLAINQISTLSDEHALKEILEHIEKLTSIGKDKLAKAVFDKAVEKYDPVLKKLAE